MTQPPAPRPNLAAAILSDAQFWIPAIVLCLGITLLLALH